LEIFGVQQSKPLKRHKLLRRVNYRGWLLPMHLMQFLCIFVHLSTEATTRIFMPLASYELWAPHHGHYKFW
jgi:hypothetical protein